jgi:hypothetical protein
MWHNSGDEQTKSTACQGERMNRMPDQSPCQGLIN